MTLVTGLQPDENVTAPTSSRPGAGTSRAWVGVFVAAMVLYGLTASRSIGWQDSGQFVLRVVRGEVTDPFGLACAHPLHFWLCTAAAKLLPVEPPAALALVSALFGALAVANAFGIVRRLTGRAGAALMAAGGLAVAHTFWRFSTFVEVYSITAALLTFEMWALVCWDQTRRPRWLVLMFLANGLGLANHDLALLTLPVIGVVLLLAWHKRQATWITLAASAVAWAEGAGIYLAMIAHEARATGDLGAAMRSALFGTFHDQVLSHGPLLTYTATSVAFTLLSFPNLMLPAALWGVARGRRLGIGPVSFWSLISAVAIHLAFVLRYAVIDQYTFLMPVYGLLAVFAGVGFADVLARWPGAWRRRVTAVAVASIALTPAVYPVAAAVARRGQVLGAYARNKPYRDDYRYLFIPWGRGEDSAGRMSAGAFDLAGANGLVVYEDDMARWALLYQSWRRESGTRVVRAGEGADAVREYARRGRPVVLVPSTPARAPDILGPGAWHKAGDLYELALKGASRPADAPTEPRVENR